LRILSGRSAQSECTISTQSAWPGREESLLLPRPLLSHVPVELFRDFAWAAFLSGAEGLIKLHLGG